MLGFEQNNIKVNKEISVEANTYAVHMPDAVQKSATLMFRFEKNTINMNKEYGNGITDFSKIICKQTDNGFSQ